MKKLKMSMVALMLSAMVMFIGCHKDKNEENNQENTEENTEENNATTPTTEGVYLGIIGFNHDLTTKDISLLNENTSDRFKNFLYGLEAKNLTALYYADYTALGMLKSYAEPPKLSNVALVTFTDGLDNASLDGEKNPENYTSNTTYLEALSNTIGTEKVYGLNINAYTIGLRGNDVQDIPAFQNNLKKLASSDDNVFEVTSMDEVMQRFKQIAESLQNTNISTSLTLLVPPGYDDGQKLRFTFDNVSSANNSNLYIECTYKRPSSDVRTLENVTYHGFNQGATTLTSNGKTQEGFYMFEIKDLKKSDGSLLTTAEVNNRLKLYKETSNGVWEMETESANSNQSSVSIDRSSALIMLVLDCTTSLGNQFSSLQTAANDFIDILTSSNSNSGGSNGGENTHECEIIINLFDTYGDGWNGATLTVSFSDNTSPKTFTLEDGSLGYQTITVTSGTNITVQFTSGNYDNEVSYTISYADGGEIFSSGTNPSTTAQTFTINCED